MFDHIVGILGLAIAAIGLVFQYRWKEVPKWATDVGLGLGCARMGAAIAPFVPGLLNVNQTQTSFPRTIAEIPAVNMHTSLKLQFYDGEHAPTEIKRENVLGWYTVWTHQVLAHVIQGEGKSKKEYDQVVVPKFWTIIVEFERPTNVNQIIIDGPANFPPYTVKWATTTYAVITTDYDIPPGIIEIKSND